MVSSQIVAVILIAIVIGSTVVIITQLPPINAYICSICSEQFTTLVDLNQHLEAVHGVQPPQFQCTFCGGGFASQEALDAHTQQMHSGPIYICPYCREQFGSQATLDLHILIYHSAQPKNKVIITSFDLSSSPSLQTYLNSHSDVKMYTMTQVLSEGTPYPEPEAPLIVNSIESIQVTTPHPDWTLTDDVWIAVSESLLDTGFWRPVGHWDHPNGFQRLGYFWTPSYVRFFADGVNSRGRNGTIGNLVITYNGGLQVTVNLDKWYPQYYEWGVWYVTISGKIQYHSTDAFKLYNFLWSKNPSHILLLGDETRVPAFYHGICSLGNMEWTFTDHPYSVTSVFADHGELLRDIPLGRIIVSTPAQVNRVFNKITGYSTNYVGRGTIVKKFDGGGYQSETNRVNTAMTDIGLTVTRIDETATLTQTLALLNGGNDLVMLSGHGSEVSIDCCTPSFTFASMDQLTFQTYTIGSTWGCGVGEIVQNDQSIVGKWLYSTTSNGIAFISFNTPTDVPSLSFVAQQTFLNYRANGIGKAFMDGMNNLEHLYAWWLNDPRYENTNTMPVMGRLAVQFSGCPWL